MLAFLKENANINSPSYCDTSPLKQLLICFLINEAIHFIYMCVG